MNSLVCGVWTKALTSVLNDAWRRQKTARDHGYGTRVPLKDELSLSDERAAEIERQVTRALCRLAQIDEEMGESKARILTLRYLDGFTWREIAAEQESSITTVRREAQFAIAWMRDHLGEPGVPSSKSP